MNLKFEFSFKPIEIKDIEVFEKNNDVVLPDNYKKFLLHYNGGKPVKRRFKTADGTVTSSLMLLFPISEETDYNLENAYKKYCITNIMPSNLIPIGVDPADSLICLTLDNQEQVYFCDMDYFDEDNELKEQYVQLISENFTSFLNNLFKE